MNYTLYSRASLLKFLPLYYLKADNIVNPALKRFNFDDLFIIKEIENPDNLRQPPVNFNLYNRANYYVVESLFERLINAKISSEEINDIRETLQLIIINW